MGNSFTSIFFKAVSVATFAVLGMPAEQVFGVEPKVAAGGDSYYHPGRKAVLSVSGVKIATIGEIHPDIAENFEIEKRVYVAEIDL